MWSHAGWTLHHWDQETRTKWRLAGLSHDAVLDIAQARAMQPPIFLWQPPQATGRAFAGDSAAERAHAALRAALQRLFPGSRGAVRPLQCDGAQFPAAVEQLLEGSVRSEGGGAEGVDGSGAALLSRSLDWVDASPGAVQLWHLACQSQRNLRRAAICTATLKPAE